MSDDLAKALAPGLEGAKADEPNGGGGDGSAPGGGAPDSAVPDWAADWPDDLKEWIAKAGHKDPAALAKGYRELEKKLGELGSGAAVRLPKDDAPEEEWRAFWRKLGAPEKPEEYALEKLAAEVLGDAADGAFLTAVQQAMAEAGVPKRQAEALARRYLELERQAMEEAENEMRRDVEALQKELGDRFEPTVVQALGAARKLCLSADDVAGLRTVLGVRRAVEMLSSLGEMLGDDRLPGAARSAPPMSKDAALRRLDELKRDPAWAKKYANGDPEAVAEYEKLVRIAYGEQ